VRALCRDPGSPGRNLVQLQHPGNYYCATLAAFRWECKIFGSTITLLFLFGN
jgi:hypothetical protein